MGVNITSIKTSSDGGWQGDNPLDYAFPLLILQTTLILVVTRSLAFFFKPLRQPKVIAEIVGGIILGPSALGRNQTYMHHVFPSWSTPILESVASIGLLFFLFLVGLELDFNSIRRSGRRALSIAAAGISLPFISGIGVAVVLRKTVHGADKVGFLQFLVFMGVALSITAFPVLARILAELKLLTTHVGETAMAAAAFNDVAAWILLALAVALAGQHKSPLVSLWVLLSGVGFVIFMMVVIRPAMKWVGRRCSEGYICLTLAGVMVSGFMTDLIGIHSIFGAFVFGLTIPKGGEFAERLIEKIEDFVSGLLLPLYFASSGLKTDVAKIRGLESWGLLGLVITTACAGKIVGTFLVALLCKMPPRDSLTLGLLMNTKGLVELIVLNIGKEKKVLNDEIFAILVLMALFTTFITTPTVMAVYKAGHSKRKLEDLKKEQVSEQLRVLACVHGPTNVPSIINLMESTRSKWPLKLFIMHLVELTERSSSILLAQRARKNGLPFFNSKWHDPLAGAFRVKVRPTTAISSLTTMHEDICHVAEEKRVAMIILPFHKQWILRRTETEDDDDDEENESSDDVEENNVGHGWRGVNQRVLRDAPCSVGVLVDRALMSPKSNAQKVCVLYFGGPDDEEALELGRRMAEHPAVKVTLVRFVEEEKEYDWRRSKCKWGGEYIEKKVESKSEIVEQVMEIGTSGGFHLIVVGKGKGHQLPPPEHPELGPIGDILASSVKGFKSSVLVIQQHHVHVPHHHHQHQPSLSNLI